jgi:hypothetical protein
MATDKTQDAKLMNLVEEFISNQNEIPLATVIRDHERKMTVAFPDGRVVTVVLYGPRGAA